MVLIGPLHDHWVVQIKESAHSVICYCLYAKGSSAMKIFIGQPFWHVWALALSVSQCASPIMHAKAVA